MAVGHHNFPVGSAALRIPVLPDRRVEVTKPVPSGTRPGFTLLELMLVVVLIGIATAMIVPEMKGTFEDMLLRSTGRTLVSAFALASSQAVTVNQPHRVRLDLIEGRYGIERAARTQAEGTGFVAVTAVPGAQGELDTRIKIQLRMPDHDPGTGLGEMAFSQPPLESRPGNVQAITFYPDGTADPVDVLLRDRAGFGLALRVNPTTARVRIEPLAPE